MNSERSKFLMQARQAAREARLEVRGPASLRVPPKRREIQTLVDWVADHPAAKASHSLRILQESYLESLGIY